MVIFLYILFILGLIALLLQCKLTLGFTLKMENSSLSVFVTVYIFGKIKVKKITIYPQTKMKKKAKAKKVRKKRDIKQLKESYYVFKTILKRSLYIKEFKLYVKEGTGDAFNTAVLYGLLWNIEGLIIKYFINDYNVKNQEIKLEADFNQKILKLDFDCIFSLKIVNIINMVISMLKLYLNNKKGGDADVGPSNRRSNDYSHAKY